MIFALYYVGCPPKATATKVARIYIPRRNTNDDKHNGRNAYYSRNRIRVLIAWNDQ